MISRRSGARVWLLAFISFWLLFAGWAFAMPYDGPPDEQQHVLRAAGVLNGDIVAGPDLLQSVPNSLAGPHCFPQQVTVPASCGVEPGGDEAEHQRYTTAARYNPVYYAVVGWPLGVAPNWHGIIGARLLNAAAMAALLGAAFAGAVRWFRRRALLAGLLVAVTPMVAHLGGAINPNGVEIAAGLSLFVALLALVHEQRDGINRAAVALAGGSACALVTPRALGVLWLAVILGAVLVPSSRARLRELAASRPVRVWAAVTAIAVAASLAWTLSVGTIGVVPVDLGFTAAQIFRTEVFDIWPNVANQMIGIMGWAETMMPRMIYVIWFMAAGLLLLGALAVGRRVDRWRLLALFVATFAPFVLAEVILAAYSGFWTQGRYYLPGAVCLPLLGATVLARGLTDAQVRSTTRLFAVLLLPIHLVCVPFTMVRFASGFISINPYNGSWFPFYGVTLPLVLATLGALALFTLFWWAARTPVESPPAAHEPDRAQVPAPAHESVGVSRR